jgi:hypothetical protein
MSWAMRVSTALVIALALAAVPLVMNQCAALCETADRALEPPCHHTSLSGFRIGHTPTPCGLDHSATVTPVTPEASPLARGLTTAVTPTVSPVPVITTVHRLVVPFASPPHEPPSRHLAVSLRV